MDFFKTLYFLRWSANISLIDFEQLRKGNGWALVSKGWQLSGTPD
nr:hypothetical protein [Pseudomonas asturiensis]